MDGRLAGAAGKEGSEYAIVLASRRERRPRVDGGKSGKTVKLSAKSSSGKLKGRHRNTIDYRQKLLLEKKKKVVSMPRKLWGDEEHREQRKLESWIQRTAKTPHLATMKSHFKRREDRGR